MDRIQLHDFDVSEFSEMLSACKGDVFLVTPEGDRLNLKEQAVPNAGLHRPD